MYYRNWWWQYQHLKKQWLTHNTSHSQQASRDHSVSGSMFMSSRQGTSMMYYRLKYTQFVYLFSSILATFFLLQKILPKVTELWTLSFVSVLRYTLWANEMRNGLSPQESFTRPLEERDSFFFAGLQVEKWKLSCLL